MNIQNLLYVVKATGRFWVNLPGKLKLFEIWFWVKCKWRGGEGVWKGADVIESPYKRLTTFQL